MRNHLNLQADLMSLESRLFGRLDQMLSTINSGNITTDRAVSNTMPVEEPTFNLYTWNNRLNKLPKTYRFPTGVAMDVMWKLYYFGDALLKLPPFRCLKASDFANRNDVTYFSKVCCLVHVIALCAVKIGKLVIEGFAIENEVAISSNIIDRSLVGKSDDESNEIFREGYVKLLSLVHPDSSRSAQISYATLYYRLITYDKSQSEFKHKLRAMIIES